MINHARNLLLNREPTGEVHLGRLGSEFIDPTYKVVNDTQLNNLRAILFGSDPDNWTLNYRAAQYMAVLHSNVRALPYVLNLDGRTTYRTGRTIYDLDFGSFITNAQASYDPPYKVTFSQPWLGDDSLGHNYYEYRVRLSTLSSVNCYVERLNPSLKIAIPQVTDQSINLPGTDVSFVIKNYQTAAGTDITWDLRLMAKPSRTLVQIATSLQQSQQVLENLWRTPGLAPAVSSFRSMVFNNRSITDTLSGVLLSIIYYQEYLRGLE